MANKDIIASGEQNDVIIYHSKDGKVNVALMTCDGRSASGRFACKERVAQPTQIATLFATSVQNVGQYIAKILKEGELDANSVVKNYFTTASDGKPYDVI